MVAVEITTVWDVIVLYESRIEWDSSSVVALEALSHVFIDTPIGEEVAGVWYTARGGRK